MSVMDSLTSAFGRVAYPFKIVSHCRATTSALNNVLSAEPGSDREVDDIRHWSACIDRMSSEIGQDWAIIRVGVVAEESAEGSNLRKAALEKLEELLNKKAFFDNDFEGAIDDLELLEAGKTPDSDLDQLAARLLPRYLKKMEELEAFKIHMTLAFRVGHMTHPKSLSRRTALEELNDRSVQPYSSIHP